MNRTAIQDDGNGEHGRRKANSYDVAELAGVSQSAVSRVFQDGASASKKMRERVLAAADKLGYQPNAIARGLTAHRSNMIAVIITRQTNLYYPEALVQLTQHFSERGMRVLLFSIEQDDDKDTVMRQLLSSRVDGIVTAIVFTPKQLQSINKAHIPVIFFNQQPKHSMVSCVRCDQEEAARLLVDELTAAGHKSFGLIAGPHESGPGAERAAGVVDELTRLGISDITTVRGDFAPETGRECFGELVRKHRSPPDAVIAVNDAMALGCIDGAREDFGLSVPDDVSVVGFDGVGHARLAAYALTTVQQPIDRMTQSAVNILMERIEKPDISPQKVSFSGFLVRGESAQLGPALK